MRLSLKSMIKIKRIGIAREVEVELEREKVKRIKDQGQAQGRVRNRRLHRLEARKVERKGPRVESRKVETENYRKSTRTRTSNTINGKRASTRREVGLPTSPTKGGRRPRSGSLTSQKAITTITTTTTERTNEAKRKKSVSGTQPKKAP